MSDQQPEAEAAHKHPVNNPEHLIIGQIVAPFGVKGDVKANILTEFPERFKKLSEVIVAPFNSVAPGLAPTAALNPGSGLGRGQNRVVTPQGWRPPQVPTPFAIQSSHLHKGQVLLKLEGVDTPEAAEALRTYWLLVPVEKALRLPRGEYYVYQLVGLEVRNEAGGVIGRLDDIITTSANDVYVVKGPGVQESSGELLVPAIKSIVKNVDIEQGTITIVDPQEWNA